MLAIIILAGAIVALAITAWYLSGLWWEIPPGLVPNGSFVSAEVDNGHIINLTFEKDVGDARYEDCRLSIKNPQGTEYIWDLMDITWTSNEAKNSSDLLGIDMKIIRSNGQTTFSTGNLIELERRSGLLAEGNWLITLNYRLTSGTIATRVIMV